MILLLIYFKEYNNIIPLADICLMSFIILTLVYYHP